MTPEQERKVEKKMERELAGHRSFPNGRDYRCFTQRNITDEERESYRNNYDRIFPNAPGVGI